ncbi:MAG: phosphoribosylglycinamide formyltransferase [Candidatus Pacebacteria bacterium]|nr:phosphoribosylglycinamide formyltransferase [Candidatus Paceibacterota bacterium]
MTAPFDRDHGDYSTREDGMSKNHSPLSQLRLAVMISGRGSNLEALLKAFTDDKTIRIVTVISNDPKAQGLRIAADHGVEARVIDHHQFASRIEFDSAVDEFLIQNRIDLICLAGFMRILSDEFVARWSGKMINIHPSLLPSYRGLNTHERVLAAGESFTGCTVHFVAPEVDSGEIILQVKVPVLAEDSPETLAARVLSAEHRLYPQAVRLIAQQKLPGYKG